MSLIKRYSVKLHLILPDTWSRVENYRLVKKSSQKCPLLSGRKHALTPCVSPAIHLGRLNRITNRYVPSVGGLSAIKTARMLCNIKITSAR